MVTVSSSRPNAPADTEFRQDRKHSSLLLPVRVLQEMDSAVNPAAAVQDVQAANAPWSPTRILSETRPDADGAIQPHPAWSKKRRTRGSVKLYDPTHIDALMERVKQGLEGRGERADMLKKTGQTLTDKGPYRNLVKPQRCWRKQLDRLRGVYPNACEVFDYLESEFLIAQHASIPLSFAPIGLVGSPGVGKSVLVEAIADLLRCTLYRVQVEISSHASALVGTALHWSNAGPGLLFQALALGVEANPIIMLDELEKCPQRDDYPNLHSVLYSLLEPVSAKKFSDASFPNLALDASHVRWMGTANSLKGIPDAIQSRMRFFQIAALTPEQSHKVLLTMDATLRAELKLLDWPALSPQVLSRLAQESPRRMRILLRAGFGAAMVRGDRTVLLQDFPMLEQVQDKPTHTENSARKGLEDLLTITNFAALRAIEIEHQLAVAQRMRSWMGGTPEQLH